MRKILLLICFLQTIILFSQNPTDVETKFGPYPGFNQEVHTITSQADGKILIGGSFSKYRGADQARLIRLNPDGSKDESFNIGTGFSGAVYVLALQNDGKILVGGGFSKFNGSVQNGIIRLNPDGSKDESFDIGTGFSGAIYVVTLQTDGKIIVGGDFINYQDNSENRLIRLNQDGSKDTTFNITSGFDKTVYSVALQNDGKILVGGDFSKFQELNVNRLIRLNEDGSKDQSFKAVSFNYKVLSIVVQNDKKILVAGWFNYTGSYTNTNDFYSLVRLNEDGTKDNSFKVYRDSFYPGDVEKIAVQSDGKILIGGTFYPANLLRLNIDGSLDQTFNVGTGFGGANGTYINAIVTQPDGNILVGGLFYGYQELSENYIIRIKPDGNKDKSFKIGSGLSSNVYCTAVQIDDKILTGGTFKKYNEISQSCLIRYNSDGTKDETFNIGSGFFNYYGGKGYVKAIAIQKDGKILAGGDFTEYQKTGQKNLIRLNTDGGIDSSFKTGTGFIRSTGSDSVQCIVIQPDGKIIIGSDIVQYQNTVSKYLIRLNSDGSVDSSFNIGSGFNASVLAIALQPDGKLIVGGKFTTYQGANQNYLIRLNADGSKDSTFNIGTGFGSQYTLGTVQTIALQPDGKILIGGQFSFFNGASQKYLIRLNADGSKDTSFNIGSGFGWYVNSILLQNDGKIIIGGEFSTYQDYYHSRLIRLNSDGSRDTMFYGNEFEIDSSIKSLNLNSDGRIIIGGSFLTYKGDNNSSCLLRLKGEYDETKLSAIISSTNTSCPDGSDGSASISVSNGKSPYSYLWSNGATTETIIGLSNGIYSCKVTDADLKTVNKNVIVSSITDNQKPTITAPPPLTVNTNLNCTATGVTLGTPVTADNCSVISATNNAPSVFPLGNTTVTWTVKDASNNIATATQIVTVKDVTLPTITAPATITINSNSNCTTTGVVLGIPTTADNCTVTSVTNNAPSTYPLGNTTVTWTVKDTNNNIATATQIVTVKDVTLPTITAPVNKTVNITSLNCTATGVVLGTPTTADNCAVTSVTNNAPTTYPLGNTTVTWTVKDASNNAATATQIITVKDVAKPTIIAPPTVIVNADSNGTATGVILGTPVTTDNCSVVSVTNDAPTTFPLGNTIITWTVKDASNNTATATQIVTVKEATPPILIPIPNFTVSTTAVNTNESISFMDNSTNTPTSWAWEITRKGSTTLTSSLQNPTFTFVDPGTYTVKLTATNGAGSNTKTVTDMITVFISLPSNNFTIESKGETCLNENNGAINITAKANYNYIATINGTDYTLTNNTLTVANLAPATYTIRITIPGQYFEQNFSVTIPKAVTITGKSTVSSRLASVEITEGTAPYTIFINGKEQFETTSETFSVAVDNGDFLEVKTAKACEGIYLKEINAGAESSILAHPNPTKGEFTIEVPISIKNINIDLYTANSKIISSETKNVTNGQIKFNIENQPAGVYYVKIYLNTPKYLKIIKK